VLYFLHRGVSSLFGAEDEQVASYLATLSGAGFTNQARRQASEATHQEREEQESRLATLFRQAEAAMAVVGSDGQLLQANHNWEENLGPLAPLQAVFPTDRDRLDQGQTVRYARRDGGVGLALPAHQRLDDGSVLTTLSDVSLARVPELLEFFEQERQWLAAELHDGPSQTLAGACLEKPDPPLRGALEELMQLMQWLASPSMDGVPFADALARLHVDIEGTTEPEVTQGTALYRVVQELLEGCSEDAALQVAQGQLTIHCSEFTPDPEVKRRVELRCELTGLRLDWLPDGARVAWSRSADL
jgi:hypothetical protein